MLTHNKSEISYCLLLEIGCIASPVVKFSNQLIINLSGNIDMHAYPHSYIAMANLNVIHFVDD
jgi:hypothetical protein